MTEKQYDEEGRVIRENRSQAKREREHIKTFARELLKLPAHQYPLLPIDETLQAALVEGKRLSGNALSRHLNYLTRLLDEQDYESIRTAHEHVNHPYLHSPGKQQRIRAEMERLLAGDACAAAASLIEDMERAAAVTAAYGDVFSPEQRAAMALLLPDSCKGTSHAPEAQRMRRRTGRIAEMRG